MGILDEFQKDICDLNAFSYEDYKNSSLDLKLKKIELLNSFYRARYNNLPKLPIFIDIDGVTLDTMNFAKRLLYMQYGIDYDKRDRHAEQKQSEGQIVFQECINSGIILRIRQRRNDALEAKLRRREQKYDRDIGPYIGTCRFWGILVQIILVHLNLRPQKIPAGNQHKCV